MLTYIWLHYMFQNLCIGSGRIKMQINAMIQFMISMFKITGSRDQLALLHNASVRQIPLHFISSDKKLNYYNFLWSIYKNMTIYKGCYFKDLHFLVLILHFRAQQKNKCKSHYSRKRLHILDMHLLLNLLFVLKTCPQMVFIK